jgi:DNA/RNA endonuclease YhcR with UshA esterase domain
MTRMHFRSVGLALAAALFAAGCDESTGPAGTPTDLTVRVYVDADGNGAFNAGDVPMAGATVTARGEDGAEATTQTDAQGAAVFTGLRPGSYVLSLAATTPAGAVLATATEPLVTATSAGGAATAEFRYAYFPGSVTGVLYRDENGNGTFEPAVDLAAPSVPVELYAGAAGGTPVATTTTTAAGAFTFPGVRPGSYTVRFLVPPGVNVVNGADQQVTVAPNAPVDLRVRFTGSLRIPISQARARPNLSPVTVEGVVTAGRGQLGPRNFYVQDASGGIQVFLPSNSPIVADLGDSVRISGGIGFFAGEVQISQGTIVVETLGDGTVPAPRNLNSAEVMARTFEGQLVRVDSLEVISITTFGTPVVTTANVVVRTPQGDQFQVRIENAANVPPTTFEVGRVYTVTGPIGINNNNIQIKPRSTADVVRTSAPTVADARAQSLGTTVTVIGVVTVAQGTFGTSNIYLQDRTGGIQVFGLPTDAAVALADSVQVTGTLGQFRGELQITGPQLTRLGTGTVPAPREVTGAELAARTFEGEMARINGVVITSVGAQSSPTSSYNVTATAPDGTAFVIRGEGRTNLERDAFTVGATYDVIGVLGSFDGAAQIKPRGTTDLIAR